MKLKPLVSLIAAAFAAPAALAAGGMVISQVYGGGGNSGAVYKNDFIEVFNASGSPINVAGWSVQYTSATGTGTWSVTNLPAVIVQPGQYLLVQEAIGAGGTTNLPTPDATGSIAMSGTTGKVALVSSTTALSGGNPSGAQIIDVLGFGPTATAFETAPTALLSNTTAALRKGKVAGVNDGCIDTNNNSADFAIAAAAPRNSAAPANVCEAVAVNQDIVPACQEAVTVAGEPGIVAMRASDLDSMVNGAAFVVTPDAGFSLGTFSAAEADGGTAVQRIQVAGDAAAGAHTLNLKWTNDEGQSATCAVNITVANTVKPIYDIQGSGSTSPLATQNVVTRGVVTKLMSNGFYLQDKNGDGNPATSDAIFVFSTKPNSLEVGQEVALRGLVSEFNTGASAQSAAHTVTELTNATNPVLLGSGYAITPVEVDLNTLPTDGLEAYEGMLVTLRGPLTVQQNFFLGRYGQLTMAAGGRLSAPTNIVRPADAGAMLADNQRRSIILDDGSSAQNVNPTPYIGEDNTIRAGDTTESITGIVDYGPATSSNTGLAMYRLQPVETPIFARSNPRTAAPEAPGGNVRVASANVLNFFTTFTNGQTAAGGSGEGCSLGSGTSAANCRGANSLAEYVRQRDKIVANLRAVNADVVGLMEIQNNGNLAAQTLVNALNNAIGSPVYAVAPLPSDTGTDAIRVAMIYKPATLGLIGSTTLADSNPINNRPTYAQGFVAPNGERFAVLVNHLKSKSSCPGAGDPDADQGDQQGCWNATRVLQAKQLRNFVGQVKAVAGTSDVILLGDFNALAKEDPIYELTHDDFVIDQPGRFDPAAYSYVFDGMTGRLDHALATPSITPKIVGAHHWHINADEPTIIDYNLEFKQPACADCGPDYYSPTAYRSSDHDPVVLGLNLVKSIKGSTGRDTIVGTPGDDVIEGGAGADTLTGNGGRDQFVYSSALDGGDTITDFKPGLDLLVLTKLLQSLGIVSADPLGQGFVTCAMSGTSAVVGFDTDGAAGPNKSRPLVSLKNVSCAALTASSFKF
nr:ExeM/NucH family extracellular endonuclease [uncultured Roseateles sp.]